MNQIGAKAQTMASEIGTKLGEAITNRDEATAACRPDGRAPRDGSQRARRAELVRARGG